MNTPDNQRKGIKKILRILAIAFLTWLLLSCGPAKPTEDLDAWHITMAQIPMPKKGCFESSYPSKEWKEVACVATPTYPQPPRKWPPPDIVGNGNDLSAEVPTGYISTAIGSFDSVTGVTSESGPIGNTGPAVANAYTLQLNPNFFTTTACAGSPNPSCLGWQQFVFENYGTGARAYIQYWLLLYNTTCPAGVGWNQITLYGTSDIYCWKNDSAGAVAVPAQAITNLAQLSLTGTVSATGDSLTMSTGSNTYAVTGDNAVNAAAGWQIAEFNVFGDGGNSDGGGMASFNSGSTIVPRTRVIYGDDDAPACLVQGFTGETNNLGFGPSAPPASPPGPAMMFTESYGGDVAANCIYAVTVGDTHLKTFGGLFYDFQASGDFVLAQVDPDFVVQTRQVSGAPTWPDASVNSAVATRMGKDTVAVCLAPERVILDGETIKLEDGESRSISESVYVRRTGNVYIIVGVSGDSVRAVVNAGWIDVTVGLGRWPAKATGLIANAEGNGNAIVARDGTVLTAPFSFEDLYHLFGDSWRVTPDESLLSVCDVKGTELEFGNPQKPFFASDLDPKVYERARKVCIAAGVKEEALLDACTLDVVVIGDDRAAQVYVGMPVPVVIGKIGK
jgi:hypothetical protein